MFEKNKSLRNLDFQCISVTKLELRHSSKYLQTFTVLQITRPYASVIVPATQNTNPCHCPGHSPFQLLLTKHQTYYMSYFSQ